MSLLSRMYGAVLTAGIPLAAVGTYRAFRGRSPDWHLARKIQPPEPLKDPGSVRIWLHGASVGEAGLVGRMMDWLREDGLERHEMLVTAQTRSGLEQIPGGPKRLMPWDFRSLLTPLVDPLPSGLPLVVVETELWPNLFELSSGRVSMVNARIKSSSFPWYLRLRPLMERTLSHCRAILCRSSSDRDRIRDLGAPEDVVETVGPMKWVALLEDPPAVPDRFPRFEQGPVLMAGSTHPGEESVVLRAAKRTGEKVYLAPRHLDRVEEVMDVGRQLGFRPKRSTELSGTVESDLIVIDELGLLAGVYGLADRAFVGGSLVAGVGGHNVLEPLVHGIPVLVGPHTGEIREFVDRLRGGPLMTIVRGEESLVESRDRTNRSDAGSALQDLKDLARTIRDGYRQHLHGLIDRGTKGQKRRTETLGRSRGQTK